MSGQSSDPYTAKAEDEPGTQQKIEDLMNFVDKNKFCMLVTRIPDSGLIVSRCMALAAKEGNGLDLIFHSNSESGKTEDIEKEPKVNVAFVNSSGEWASISGEASIDASQEMREKYYSPALKAWLGDLGDGKHDGGPQDPRIVCIRVKAQTAQYTISNATLVGSLVQQARGAITGEVPNVNKLRFISDSELKTFRG